MPTDGQITTFSEAPFRLAVAPHFRDCRRHLSAAPDPKSPAPSLFGRGVVGGYTDCEISHAAADCCHCSNLLVRIGWSVDGLVRQFATLGDQFQPFRQLRIGSIQAHRWPCADRQCAQRRKLFVFRRQNDLREIDPLARFAFWIREHLKRWTYSTDEAGYCSIAKTNKVAPLTYRAGPGGNQLRSRDDQQQQAAEGLSPPSKRGMRLNPAQPTLISAYGLRGLNVDHRHRSPSTQRSARFTRPSTLELAL